MAQITHYEILTLPRSLLDDASPEQATQIVKRAYHRALLQHHPDKAIGASASLSSSPPSKKALPAGAGVSGSSNKPAYTIDQIITAYTVLSTPSTKKSYDQSLQTSNSLGGDNRPDTTFQTGIETIDLDDLSTSTSPLTGDQQEITWWWKSCRCGNPQGFRFGETDLEEAGDLGELIVGCQDCSLWLRVHFAVVEDEGEDG